VARQLICPTCSRTLEWSEAYPYRPFCSERCRLVDLGGWLTEKHVIPGEAVEDAAGSESPAPADTGPDEGLPSRRSD